MTSIPELHRQFPPTRVDALIAPPDQADAWVGTDSSDPMPEAVRRVLAECAHADHVVLTRRQRARLVVEAATDDTGTAVDTGQSAAGRGPVVDALDLHRVTVTDDLRTDPRWPGLAEYVPEAIRSALCIPLAAHGHPDAVLNLYSACPDSFDDDAVAAARRSAVTVALTRTALAWRQNAENLTVALRSSRRIGAAIGILMCRLQLTDDQAFQALRLISQDTHRKLRDVAEDVLLTGLLPEPTRRPGRRG